MRSGLAAFLLVLVAAVAGAKDSEKPADGKAPSLTPFDWKKTSPGVQESPLAGGNPRLKGLSQTAAPDDELVCEKDVVHPTKAPQPGSPAAVMQNINPLALPMGVQHCWKKSDPHAIIERPFRLGDPLLEAVSGAAHGDAPSTGFAPLMKPRMRPAKKKPAAAPAAVVAVSSAAAPPAPATAPAPTKVPETPQLLR